MKNVRTLTELRNELKGRIYIWCGDTPKGIREFCEDAEKEGFRFGKTKPTESGGANIVALEGHKQLSYVGFVGHAAFQCPSAVSGAFYRIDYNKFKNGDKDYFFMDKPVVRSKEFSGKFYDSVTVIGEAYIDAAAYIKKSLADCKNIEEEEELYATASQKFDVLVLEE